MRGYRNEEEGLTGFFYFGVVIFGLVFSDLWGFIKSKMCQDARMCQKHINYKDNENVLWWICGYTSLDLDDTATFELLNCSRCLERTQRGDGSTAQRGAGSTNLVVSLIKQCVGDCKHSPNRSVHKHQPHKHHLIQALDTPVIECDRIPNEITSPQEDKEETHRKPRSRSEQRHLPRVWVLKTLHNAN